MIASNKTFRLLAAVTAVVAVLIARRENTAAATNTTTRPAAVDLLPLMAMSPQTSARATIAPLRFRPYLPPAMVGTDPRMLPADGLRPVQPGQAMDVPPLAQGGLALPAEAELPAGPPIHVATTDSAAPPVATIAAKPDHGIATLTTDPTAGMARSGALSVAPPPRKVSPPALLLPIPDPSHQVGFIPLNRPSVEDPPAMDIDLPGPTTLPVNP